MLRLPEIMGWLLLLTATSSIAQAQQKQYREITDWGGPNLTAARPQLGTPARFAQYAPGVSQPADQRPVLNSGITPSGTANYAQPVAYGYGFVNGCAWNRPTGYANTLPPVGYAPVSQVQPISATTPISPALGGLQPPPNSQPWSWNATPFNPYGNSNRETPWRPLVPIRSMPTNYEVGQGIVGQPKIYVPNQPFRNFLRYLTP